MTLNYDIPRFLTLEECGRELGLTRQRMSQLYYAGKLAPAVQIGETVGFAKAELQRLERERKAATR